MEPAPHILVVDDDREIRDLLSRFLEKQGMRVTAARDAREARKVWPLGRYHLVVLDLMMPGEPGLDFARWLRGQSDVPIVILTAMGEETDRIVGLEMGADDYVLKPFSPRELVARIKTILRRAGSSGGGERESSGGGASLYRFEGWTLRTDDWTLTGPDEVAIPLSTADFRLLQAFVTHPRQVLSRDQLLDLTQGREAHAFDRSIDNQISRLRRKLEDDARAPTLIKTVWGGGYMLSADVTRT